MPRGTRVSRALTALGSVLVAVPAFSVITAPAPGAAAAAPVASAASAASALPEVQAQPADSLVDAFGVSVHLNYLDTPYAETSRVRKALTDLGVRHVRTNLDMSVPQSYAAMRDIASAGVRFDLIMGRPGSWQTPEKLVQTVATELPTGVVESLEGANEYNLDPSAGNWAAELLTHQQALYQAAKANPVTAGLPVLAPALGNRTGFNQVTDLGQYADYGNAHLYPGGRPPSWGIDQMTALEATVVPGKPVMYTETGYHDAMNSTSGQNPTPPSVVGTYAPRILLEHYLRGTSRVYDYELLDERPDPAATDNEASFGLLNDDFTPKPAYTALQNLLGLVADPGPAIAPGKLAYRVDGAPQDLRQVLVQRRDGDFLLLLWRDVSVYDPSTGLPRSVTPARVTVRLGALSSVTAYRPSVSRNPFSTTTGTSVDLALGAEVTALRIRSPLHRPTAPKKLRAKTRHRSVVLRWKPPASDGGAPVTGYVVTRAPGKRRVTVDGVTHRLRVRGLRPGVRYRFKVAAVNAAGVSRPVKVRVILRRGSHGPGPAH